MLVVWGEGQQRSGRLGATIASRNRFGAYLRAGTIPVNPSTDRQVLIRGYIAALQIAWNIDLTQDQRDAWNEYGANVAWKNRLGQTVHLTGPNHYIRTNTIALLAGLPRVDAAPIIFDVAAPEQALSVAASAALGTLAVSFAAAHDWCSEDNAAQLVYMGIPVNPGKKFFAGPYRFCGAILGDSIAPITSPQDITAVNVPWPYGVGQRIWVRTRIIRADGRVSDYAQTNFLSVA